MSDKFHFRKGTRAQWSSDTIADSDAPQKVKYLMEDILCTLSKTKVCVTCQDELAFDQYYAGPARMKLQAECKKCWQTRRKKTTKRTRESVDSVQSLIRLRNTNGCTKEEEMKSWESHVEKHGLFCACTGLPFSHKDDFYKPSPDRIVPGVQGGKYTVDNIRWVIRGFNLMRREYGDETVLKVCKAVCRSNGFAVLDTN